MNTKKPKTVITNPALRREFWLGTVKAYLRSGVSAAQFAGKQGLSIHSLRDWTKKFRREFGEGWATEEPSDNASAKVDEGHFVEVKGRKRATQRQSTGSISVSEICTPGGFRIGMSTALTSEELISFITTLKEANC